MFRQELVTFLSDVEVDALLAATCFPEHER